MFVALRHRSHFEHPWTFGDLILDLVRIDLEARDDDHVLLAILNEYEAALIETPDIAGAQPALRQHDLFGFFGPLPVAAHHLRTAQTDLPDRSDRQRAASLLRVVKLGDGTGSPNEASEHPT